MNRTALIESLSRRTGLDRHLLEVAFGSALRIIQESLTRGETVALSGFGTFTVRQRAARQGRNPRTGGPIAIPASRSVSFKAAKAWREQLSARPEA